MGSSLFAGISGLASSGKQLDVIANNIANVNTVGFRSGKIHFGDILSQSVTGGSAAGMQVGRGVEVTGITTQFSPGSFETTANATDLAIDGDGFFMVQDADGGEYYTRAGAFSLNNEGYLVDVNGYKVQGKTITAGVPGASISDISLSGVQSAATASSYIRVGANLDDGTTNGGTFNASQTVYDSKGGIHSLKATFQKTEGNGVWGVEAYLDDVATTAQSKYGIKFDTDGVLEKIYTGAVGAVAAVTDGDGDATAFVDRPGQVSHTGTIQLARGLTVADWTIVDNGGYAGLAVIGTPTATTVEICLDGMSSTVADVTLTLTGTWAGAVPDTATFTVEGCEAGAGLVTVVGGVDSGTVAFNNPEKFVTAGTLKLTRDATVGSWDFEGDDDDGGYDDYTILSTSDTTITIALDGGVDADITLTLAGTPADNDTAAFTLAAGNGETPIDIELTMPSIEGATIGTSGSGVVSWDMVGTTSEAITGYASTSVVKTLAHDGYSSGSLKSISASADGTISGFFTNGQTSDIARIMLAGFPNTGGLKRMGKNLFGTTVESGDAIRNDPGAAGMGDISPNSLEMSNTDIATEFINMITAQRAYQASAKIVTVTDQMMAELMNIKR